MTPICTSATTDFPRRSFRPSGKHIFALKIYGDSMEPEQHNGDLLIINPEIAFHATRGEKIGVVKLNGEYIIRRVHFTPDYNNYLLEPLNKAYETEIIPITGTTIFEIVDLRPQREDLF